MRPIHVALWWLAISLFVAAVLVVVHRAEQAEHRRRQDHPQRLAELRRRRQPSLTARQDFQAWVREMKGTNR
jgi:hypothetical protein